MDEQWFLLSVIQGFHAQIISPLNNYKVGLWEVNIDAKYSHIQEAVVYKYFNFLKTFQHYMCLNIIHLGVGGAAKAHKSSLHAIASILRQEGVFGVYNGLVCWIMQTCNWALMVFFVIIVFAVFDNLAISLWHNDLQGLNELTFLCTDYLLVC